MIFHQAKSRSKTKLPFVKPNRSKTHHEGLEIVTTCLSTFRVPGIALFALIPP